MGARLTRSNTGRTRGLRENPPEAGWGLLTDASCFDPPDTLEYLVERLFHKSWRHEKQREFDWARRRCPWSRMVTRGGIRKERQERDMANLHRFYEPGGTTRTEPPRLRPRVPRCRCDDHQIFSFATFLILKRRWLGRSCAEIFELKFRSRNHPRSGMLLHLRPEEGLPTLQRCLSNKERVQRMWRQTDVTRSLAWREALSPPLYSSYSMPPLHLARIEALGQPFASLRLGIGCDPK
jgi:hypothetical protein